MNPQLIPGTWNIDAAHSTIEFTVRHLGLSNVRGRFDRFSAALRVDEKFTLSTVTADIELASVNTNNADRDQHLRSGDFFGIEKNGTMAFRSTSVSGAGEKYSLTGDLTINGITKPVTLDVEFTGAEVYPFDKKTHVGFSARAVINRGDFGMRFNVPLGMDKFAISDSVKIELELQFVAP